MIHDGKSLSRFLTLPGFWDKLAPAKHIFFFQADSMMCGNSNKSVNDYLGLDMFPGSGYDWVGTSSALVGG